MPSLRPSIKASSSGSDEGEIFPLKFVEEDSESEYSDDDDDVLSLYEKPLPPPPINPDKIAQTILGRQGMGAIRQRSPSPLTIEWDPEEEIPLPRNMSIEKAMRRRITTSTLSQHSARSSVASTESLWFALPIPEVPRSIPPASQKWAPLNIKKERPPHISLSDSDMSRGGSIYAFSNSSTDTHLTSPHPRIRIITHDSDMPPREIYNGRLHETISYIWETTGYPENLRSLDNIAFRLATSENQLVSHVKMGSLTLAEYMRTAELVVHVLRGNLRLSQVGRSVDLTSLNTVEITVPAELVDMLNTCDATAVLSIKSLLRIHVITEIGEFLASHVMYRGQAGVMITKSLDLSYQTGNGGEAFLKGMLGGVVRYRKVKQRVEVLFTREGEEVRRIPKWVLEEFYQVATISKLMIDALDF
jgi:hypothetical protein